MSLTLHFANFSSETLNRFNFESLILFSVAAKRQVKCPVEDSFTSLVLKLCPQISGRGSFSETKVAGKAYSPASEQLWNTPLTDLANGFQHLPSKPCISSPALHLILAPHSPGVPHHLEALSQERARQCLAPYRESAGPPSPLRRTPTGAEEESIRQQVTVLLLLP